MDIPGFTAKASLTNNSRQYYNLFSDKSFSLTSSALQLQIDSSCLRGTHWGDFERGPCRGGQSRRSAVLYDIPWGCSWEDTCMAKRATIDGQDVGTPEECINNGFNIHGIFHTPCSAPPPPPPPPPPCGGPTRCPPGNWLVTVGCQRWCRTCDTDDHCGFACVNCHGRGCFRDFGGYHCGA